MPLSDYGTTYRGNGVDQFVGVSIQPGYGAVDYNFAELGLVPSLASKQYFLVSTMNNGNTTYWPDGPPIATPEPGTLVMFGVAALCGGLTWYRRRTKTHRE